LTAFASDAEKQNIFIMVRLALDKNSLKVKSYHLTVF